MTVEELLPFWEKNNFSVENEQLIDQGRVIDGFPLSYSGKSPDIGAYEQGDNWSAGTYLDTISIAPWPWNLMGDASIATISSPLKIVTTSSAYGEVWRVFNLQGKMIAETENPLGNIESISSNQVVILKSNITGVSIKRLLQQ